MELPKVAVIMSTYNGERYLEKQIDSIFNQNNVSVDLHIRDDGSIDDTVKIIKKKKLQYVNIFFIKGDNIGSTKSFLLTLDNLRPYDFYAFADQDDIWENEKLKSAIAVIDKNRTHPQLYYSCLNMVDDEEQSIGKIKSISITNFASSLICNGSAGCTMVFNYELKKQIIYDPQRLPNFHDEYIHRVCLGVGGSVYHDFNSYIKYRIHSNNQVGRKRTVIKYIEIRLMNFIYDKCKLINSLKNLNYLYENKFTDNNIYYLKLIINYKSSFKNKVRLLLCKDIRTPNKLKNIEFILAVLFNKF